MDDALRSDLSAALDRLGQEGCPFAVPPHDVMMGIGIRRWNSFARRNRIRHPTREDHIADLARGLYERLQPRESQSSADPLMRDVECVAETIANVLDPPLTR